MMERMDVQKSALFIMRFTVCFVVTALQSYKKEMNYAIIAIQIHSSTPYTTCLL